MDEDPGVLGKLPRSRPGMRSAKRDAAPRPAKAPAGGARSQKRPAATTARPPSQARSRPSPPPASDPLGDVVRTGAKVAGAGVKVAGGVTRGLLRRLPRP